MLGNPGEIEISLSLPLGVFYVKLSFERVKHDWESENSGRGFIGRTITFTRCQRGRRPLRKGRWCLPYAASSRFVENFRRGGKRQAQRVLARLKSMPYVISVIASFQFPVLSMLTRSPAHARPRLNFPNPNSAFG